MTSFEIPGENSDRAVDTTAPADESRTAESVEVPARDERSTRRFTSSRVMGVAERERALTETRDVDFPISLRGYDRVAVDRYVERVTRVLTELEMSSSPEAAVRHALDEVSEETRDILQRAHQTADEITARSRSRADDRLQQAEHEAQEVLDAARREAETLREATAGELQNLRETSQRETSEARDRAMHEIAELRETAARETQALRASAQHDSDELRTAAQRESDEVRGSARREAEAMVETAEARARELTRNAEAIWRERRRLIDDMRAVGDQLVAIGEVEGKRFPRPVEDTFPGAEPADEPGAATNGEPAPAAEPVSSTTPT
jgi:cell division septum initiation protein DivIVA